MKKCKRSYRIIGYDNTVTAEDLKAYCMKNKAPREMMLEPLCQYVKLSKKLNVNLAFAFAQFAKETGFLYKNGSAAGLDASYHNPCGLKIKTGGGDFDRYAHKVFPDWETGITAHLDHALLYAGAPGYPKKDTPDPRHFKFLLRKAPTVIQLSGNWAPSVTYGSDIIKMMDDIYSIVDRRLAREEESSNTKPTITTQKVIVYTKDKELPLVKELAEMYGVKAIHSELYKLYSDEVKKVLTPIYVDKLI